MAVADEILAAVKTIIETAFATEGWKCHPRRASSMNPAFAPGMSVPCFVAHLNADRPTEMAWVGKKFVKYTLAVEFGAREIPGKREPDPLVEDAVARVAKLFLKGKMAGAPAVVNVDVRPKAPYEMPYGDKTLTVAGVAITVETLEDAN